MTIVREKASKYIALYETLLQEIVNGAMPVGTKMPSESLLIKMYGYSRQTVRKSLDKLATEGYIETIQGSGSFVKNTSKITVPKSGESVVLMALSFDHHYFPLYIKGIEDTLKGFGISLIIKSSNYHPDEEEAGLLEAMASNVRGILLFPAYSASLYHNLYLYRQIQNKGIPIITLGNPICMEDIPFVGVDDYAGGDLVGKHLLQMGHTKIVCIMNANEVAGRLRYAGFVSALKSAGIKVDPNAVLWYGYGEFKEKCGSLAVEKAKESTAIFCYNDEIAIQLCQMLQSVNMSIPGDVSVVGYDDSYLSNLGTVKLTTVAQNPYNIGCAAADQLVRCMRGSTPAKIKLFPPSLVKRESVAQKNIPG